MSKKITQNLRMLSLFSGCGGMDLGFEGAFICHKKSVPSDSGWIDHPLDGDWVSLRKNRFETVFANDILEEAYLTWNQYFSRFGKDPSIYHLESIVDLVKRHHAGEKVFPDGIDLVTGGFPCQDFSVAGKRLGFESHTSHDGTKLPQEVPSEENRGKLYFWMKQVIDIVKPKVFIAENVKGLTNLGNVKEIIQRDFLRETWATVYVTVLATLFAIIIGLPLGCVLVMGDAKGIRPLPAWLMKTLNVIINFLRSVPFLILIVMVIPLTRLIVGTSVGTVASIVPLVVAAFPFVARLVEGSLREVSPNVIETAQSMGATPMQILLHVMLPESVPSLITNFTLAITTILGYTAMSGAIGGGGIGKTAITIGYQRYRYAVLYACVIVLVILVQLFQSIGTWLARKADKRLKQ